MFALKSFMSDFFKDVESVKSDISAIRDATKSIAQLNENAYMASSAQQEQGITKRVNYLLCV